MVITRGSLLITLKKKKCILSIYLSMYLYIYCVDPVEIGVRDLSFLFSPCVVLPFLDRV